MKYFTNIFKARYILLNLIKQDLKNRYRNSVLGIIWTMLTPLGLVGIIGGVYSVVFNLPFRNFAPFIFSGILPWFYIQNCADGGVYSFLAAEGYIKQTQTPIEIFPIRVALGALVNLLFALGAFFIIYIFVSPEKFNLNMLMIIPAILIWLIMGCGISTISGIINVYIRDYAPLQALILQGVFYITPIIYPVEVLKNNKFDWVYKWNPFYYILEIIRRPLLGEGIPGLSVWAVAIAFSLILFVIGYISISSIGRKITFKL